MSGMKITDWCLGWVETFRNSEKSYRSKIVKTIIEGVSKFDVKNKTGEGIVKDLKDQCELIGVMPFIPYIRSAGDDLERMFIHSFGQPTLVYHVKGTCCLLVVNPALRLNNNVIVEEGKSKAESGVGISG